MATIIESFFFTLGNYGKWKKKKSDQQFQTQTIQLTFSLSFYFFSFSFQALGGSLPHVCAFL